MKQNNLIALDADGVMLDFDAAYIRLWEKVFGYKPKEINPDAYWAFDRYDVPYLEGEDLINFKKHFDANFWYGIPAIPGARDAVNRLVYAGYNVVCVSALPEEYEFQRFLGLYDEGFIIDKVYACGAPANAAVKHANNKASVLNALQPLVFVDDYLPYHEGLDSSIKKVLIDRNPIGSPNSEPMLQARIPVDMKCKNLVEFVDKFLDANR